jgi:hypothetical protein
MEGIVVQPVSTGGAESGGQSDNKKVSEKSASFVKQSQNNT